ncbi:MAG TPA: TadE family protein [Sphingomicrobium sp.]|nr:TadE family protein [Sphingomicrobium sp.]
MIRAIFSCERGNSFVEMALTAPILAALLLGMVDISRGVSTKLQLVQAAQRTVELAQRSGFQYADIADLEAEAETAAGTGSNATVTGWLECGSSTTRLSWTSTCSSGQAYSRHIDVTITRPFTPLFGVRFFPGANSDGTFTVSALAGVRVQ